MGAQATVKTTAPRRPGRVLLVPAVLLAALLGAGCDRGPKVEDGVVQTRFPGQVSAGGGTSGEVIAQSGGKQAAPPAGTPGIPQGSEGNVGGAALGGAMPKDGASAAGVPQGEGPQKAASAAADPGPTGVVPPGVSASAVTSGAAVGGMSNAPGAVAGASSGAAGGGSRPASSPGVR
ncbi:hypothetical protein [uncultured Azohydromonas sp.]|uniref:hypothetical protein n=1 Tax=uncultured Azohydromonas sp. TaxID=487342 RepID=UPI00260F4C4D|nr:hypothetical protein [uncultured Azohydromonas sp.]